jgi:hypothetical protein
MERQQLTINLKPLNPATSYFDNEQTRVAQRVVPLATVAPANRQNWKMLGVIGVALLCGALGGLVLGLSRGRRENAPEVIPTSFSASETVREPLPAVTISVKKTEVAAPAEATPRATPKPAARAAAVKNEAAIPVKSEPSVIPAAVTPDAPPANNGLVRPRRVSIASDKTDSRAALPVSERVPQLSLAQPKQ